MAGSIRPPQSLPAPDELPEPWIHQCWAGLVTPNWSPPRAQNWFGSWCLLGQGLFLSPVVGQGAGVGPRALVSLRS